MKAQVISFKCELKNKAGQLISSTYNRDVLNSVENQSDMLSGLVRGLQNLAKGERRSIVVAANEAYGLYDPQKVIFFLRSKLPQNLKPGQPVSIVGKSGLTRCYTVIELNDEYATLDGNHPLAGQDLVFEIEALEVRAATREEIDDSTNSCSVQHLH